MGIFRRNPEKKAEMQQRVEAYKDERVAAKERVGKVRQFTKDNASKRMATVGVGTKVFSLYPDRIIRLPLMGTPMDGDGYDDMMRPIEGVSAELREFGSVSSRSTLTRTMVPGAHGWQKKEDNRTNELVITGPEFVWTITVPGNGGLVLGPVRKFVAAVNNAGVGGHRGGTQQMW